MSPVRPQPQLSISTTVIRPLHPPQLSTLNTDRPLPPFLRVAIETFSRAFKGPDRPRSRRTSSSFAILIFLDGIAIHAHVHRDQLPRPLNSSPIASCGRATSTGPLARSKNVTFRSPSHAPVVGAIAVTTLCRLNLLPDYRAPRIHTIKGRRLLSPARPPTWELA